MRMRASAGSTATPPPAAPDVIAVFTGADMAADKVGPMAPLWAITSADGKPMAEPPRWALARETVRHVGEPVALVVAETLAQARDAADLVDVDYEPLPSVTDATAAIAAGAPQLHEAAPGNICFRFARGDQAAVAKAFAGAAHVVRLDLVNNRLIGAALEPRALLADGSAGGKLTLYCATQVPHHIRRVVSEQLNLPQTAIRLVAPDVGGGFGYKGKHYPEETIIAWAARRLRRPVKWIATRSECFISDNQARDHQTHAELALDREGNFLALRVDTVANLGAYVSTFGAAIPSAIYSALLAGVYRTPAIATQSTGVFTNTLPTDAYRGAGRPEACYVLERLADEAAHVLGVDRAEIRRRNLIAVEAMPYKTPIGPTYDCGNFPKILSRLLQVADYDGFGKRRTACRSARKNCAASGSPATWNPQAWRRRALPPRWAPVSVSLSRPPSAFNLTAACRLCLAPTITARVTQRRSRKSSRRGLACRCPPSRSLKAIPIRCLLDQARSARGRSRSAAPRSIAPPGKSSTRASGSRRISSKPRRTISRFTGGLFSIAGTDRSVTLREVARVAHVPTLYPPDEELGLQDSAFYDPSGFAWSNGAHACEVEIDRETGDVRVIAYWGVDDVGTVINPMIVEGQIQGGIAQGLGQALRERCVYDPTNGQLLSGSFMDYALPRASDMPAIVSELDESQPCTHNPLGAKGCGEAGSIGAPAAIVSAVLDALRPCGVTDVQLPLTPEQIWKAMQPAGRTKRSNV